MRRKGKVVSYFPYSWNEQIEDARSDCNKKRRLYTRMNRRGGSDEEFQTANGNYKEARKELRRLGNLRGITFAMT